MKISIRKAETKDIEKTLNIYNHEVEHGVATLDLHPKTLAEWEKWFLEHSTHLHPLFVAEINHEVVGYASLSPYREKEAYKSTVELSIYVDSSYRNQGVASALMDAILVHAEQNDDIHTIISVITRGNEASKKFHEKYHFTFCGTIHAVGMKFGSYLDIDNYELIKQDGKFHFLPKYLPT